MKINKIKIGSKYFWKITKWDDIMLTKIIIYKNFLSFFNIKIEINIPRREDKKNNNLLLNNKNDNL